MDGLRVGFISLDLEPDLDNANVGAHPPQKRDGVFVQSAS